MPINNTVKLTVSSRLAIKCALLIICSTTTESITPIAPPRPILMAMATPICFSEIIFRTARASSIRKPLAPKRCIREKPKPSTAVTNTCSFVYLKFLIYIRTSNILPKTEVLQMSIF